jgi:hypothetical protein
MLTYRTLLRRFLALKNVAAISTLPHDRLILLEHGAVLNIR